MKLIETRQLKRDPHKTIPSCEGCFEQATKEVLFELAEAIVIQRYCDKCIQENQYKLLTPS